jgi:hypothetical protein
MKNLFRYLTIILSFIGLTLSTAYADPIKVGFIYINNGKRKFITNIPKNGKL